MTDLSGLDADLERLGPLVTFPWHTQQSFALAAAADVIVVLGGTQSGKTEVGGGAAGRLVRREGPLYRRLLNSSKPISGRPMKLWVAPQTLEKFESNWEDRLLHKVFAGIDVEYVRSPFRVMRWHDGVTRALGQGPNELWCKSHDQGYRAFESDVVDGIFWDEEPVDKRVWSSGRHRGTTVNGFNFFTFTPINGMSWTYHDFYQPTVKDAFKVADRVWKRGRSIVVVQMGMADNPTAVAGGGVQRILDDPSMTEAEKRTRLYGDYGYTEGLLWPEMAAITAESNDVHLLDALPESPMSWVLAADPNKRHGAVLCGLDPFGNYFIADEHYLDSVPDSQHAQAYHEMLARWRLGVDEVLFGADPGGAGAQAILNLADFDLPFQAVEKDAGSVSASIKLVRRLLWVDPQHVHPVTGELGAPRLYFLRSLRSRWREDGVEHFESRLLYEMRQYRQKDGKPPDTPIKERDDCVDPLRYVLLMRPWKPEPEDVERTQLQKDREKLDPFSRKVDDEFERMVAEAAKNKRLGKGMDFSAR